MTRQSIIDPSVLTELGKMYTTISQTMRELVQNGFDSYANNVYMEINIPENYIKVTDDGVGMNDYVVINHYANVGMSTKKKELSEFPTVPSTLNSHRPKIGKKGMGKLSWILVAKEQETTTTCIDDAYSIYVKFNANNLQEYDEPKHVNKHARHGTTILLKDLQITDIKQEDINEFVNTTGFLHEAFNEFNIYLTVKSPSLNITNQKIVKILAEGYQFKSKEIYEYREGKRIDGEYKIIKKEDIPYEFTFRLPSAASREKSEFWLLSGYMGIKKLQTLEGFSGYLNIDNIELVANRNDIQTGEKDKVESITSDLVTYIVKELEKMYINEQVKESDVLIYLDGNQQDIINMIYNNNNSREQSETIGKYFKFDFYAEGAKRLVSYLETENVIYYFNSSTKTIADKATHYGYKCFSYSGWNTEWVIQKAFTTPFIQSISNLPKEAYESAGTTIKPVGSLGDILKNLGMVFDSLSYAYSKVTSKVEDLQKELEEKADSLTAEERAQKEKELSELLARQQEVHDKLSEGREESGETDDDDLEAIEEKKKAFKSQKKKAFKQATDHYFDMSFDKYKMKVGFAFFDDPKIVADIHMKYYIHLNLNNEYVKSATEQKNYMKQLILLLPHICHEVSHLWSSEHGEVFQMVNNMLLIPALDHLLRSFHDSPEFVTTKSTTPIQQTTQRKVVIKRPPMKTKMEKLVDESFKEPSKKADEILKKLSEEEPEPDFS